MDRRSTDGRYVVIILVLIIAAVAGGLIWHNRPKSNAPLAATLQTDVGLMLLVPGGRFIHGPNNETAIVPPFYIDQSEVTNAAYAKFCEATNRSLPKEFPSDRLDNAVVNVTFLDATDFARWAGKRLPDALEWEKAARGSFNLLHLSDNVLEYARNEVRPGPEAVERFSSILNPPAVVGEAWYTVKGGSLERPLQAVPARYASPDISFRCVKDPTR